MSKIKKEFIEKVGGLVPRISDNYTGEHSTYMSLLENWDDFSKTLGEYFDQALAQKEEEVLDMIALNEGWEESRDYYARKLGLPEKYNKLKNDKRY